MPLETSQAHLPSRAPGLAVPASTKVAAGADCLAAAQQQRWEARLAVIGASMEEGPRTLPAGGSRDLGRGWTELMGSLEGHFPPESGHQIPAAGAAGVDWPAAATWPKAAT